MPSEHDPDRGRLLHVQDMMEITRFPEETIRSKYHAGTLPCVWKLGRRLVAWEKDLREWMDQEQARTTKVRDGSAPTEDLKDDLEAQGVPARDWLAGHDG